MDTCEGLAELVPLVHFCMAWRQRRLRRRPPRHRTCPDDVGTGEGEVFDPYHALDGDSEAGGALRSFLQWVAHPDKCSTLDEDEGGPKETPATADICEEGRTEQHWMIPAGTGPITSAKQHGQCLTVEGAENADGRHERDCEQLRGGWSRSAVDRPRRTGTGQIKWATNPDMCLDAQALEEGSAEAPGLIIWTCHGEDDPLSDNQQWHIAKASAVAQAG
ncbi:unnamed protein product [Prorocentrum cordatum]|uniref:Ricin B lectin domain-containing protein n=1 Tax=Prorocentrum cordatum TaxID=2364126 RepID=A0ABN9TM99_9DINO|nr:unnamed protein product [Polarella glacialis]